MVRGDQGVFGVNGRSAEQRIAIDALTDESVGIVSLGGRAGTGKSALALMAGLQAVLEDRSHQSIKVFRPLYAVGGQNLGYLPGSEGDKMNPWAEAVFDTLGALVSQNVIDEVRPPGDPRGPSAHAHPRTARCMTPSSSSTRRSHWSGPSCSRCCPGWGRTPASSSPTTSPSADNLRVGTARRHHRRHRPADGASAVRALHADAVREVRDRRARDRGAGGGRAGVSEPARTAGTHWARGSGDSCAEPLDRLDRLRAHDTPGRNPSGGVMCSGSRRARVRLSRTCSATLSGTRRSSS